jgi:hypothetical protein
MRVYNVCPTNSRRLLMTTYRELVDELIDELIRLIVTIGDYLYL